MRKMEKLVPDFTLKTKNRVKESVISTSGGQQVRTPIADNDSVVTRRHSDNSGKQKHDESNFPSAEIKLLCKWGLGRGV